MGRPRKQNRDDVRRAWTIKLSDSDHRLLAKLVAAREEEIRGQTGEPIQLSLAGYLRGLWERDARARGLLRGDAAKGSGRRAQ